MKDKRSSHTVDTDRWDRADYARVRTEIAQIGAATESLAQITPTAQPEMFDVFQMFMKSRPEFLDLQDIRDDHRIDLAVNEQAEELPEFRDLRRFTRGDLVGAAMAAVKVEPEFETLFDREKFRQRQAEEIQRLREELLDKLAQQQAQPGEGGTGGDLQDEIDALRRAIAAAELALEEGLGEDKDSISAQLARAMAGATDEARENTENARAYGIEPGRLTRMPADERLKLAARLNTARLRKIAQLFGPLRNLAFAARQRTVPTLPHEMIGVTVGRDLERLLPGELLRFADPDQEDAFYVDYAERRLLTYKVRGKEKVGKGGIIVLEDGSGSMAGVRELQAKAIMLVMMNIAKKEHRTFHLIHFGSKGQTKHFSFTKPTDFTLDRIVEAAEFFLSSGPLRVDQRVVTPEGWKAIGNVEVGDRVFGPNGRERSVLGVYPQGELDDVYRVTFRDDAEVICDGRHLWTVLDRTRNGVNVKDGVWKTARLSDLIEAGIRANHNGWRFSVPVTDPVVLPEADLPLDPYLLGYMIGNGGFGGSTPKITSMPGDQVEWMKCVPRGVNVIDHEKREGFCPSWSLTGGDRGLTKQGDNPVTEALRDLGLWGHLGVDKFIPEAYLWASVDQRWALLQGLLDSDGNATPGRRGGAAYGTCSPKLAEGIVQLVQSLGGLAKCGFSPGKKEHWAEEIKIGLHFPGDRNPFRLARKAELFEPRHNHYLRSIVKVEKVASAECVCIKVDSDDGLFLTEGFVTTHNTDFQTPFGEGMEILKSEFARTGKVESDIVMVSDGECSVTDEWLTRFHADLDHVKGTAWGILIGNDGGAYSSGTLRKICNGLVCNMTDLTNGGKEIAGIFKGVRRSS